MNEISRLAYATTEQRWEAVRTRDAKADGRFFCCDLSTGIYCYPSCAGRPARVENVTFHDTREAAIRAGFRACKRCRSDLAPRAEREATLIASACRAIEAAEEPKSLDELAAQAGFSPFHFHRLFRRVTGVTPKSYAAAHRMGRVQDNLSSGASVTETIYDSGFNSSGRFYEAADAMLGMTPTAWRAGGKGETISWATGESTLGCVLVAGTARGICAILIGDAAHELVADLQSRFPKAALLPAETEVAAWVEQVIAYVDRPGNGIGLPLDIRGTAFQRQVWEVLQTIPVGETLSYSDVAARLGNPRAVRAVAGACAANKLAVAVPCHRVVASNGTLAGYRWGIARKKALLTREQTSQQP